MAWSSDPYTASEKGSTQADTEGEVMHAALLQGLHRKLEQERLSHVRTKEEADAEISRLRAMVARRDAELEACATHSSHQLLLSSSLSSDPPLNPHLSENNGRTPYATEHERVVRPTHRSHGAVLREEQDPIVSLAITRQRTLEREVDLLQGQVSFNQYIAP